MPSPSQTTGGRMILDYPYIEVYMPKDIKYITDNYIKRKRTQIVQEYKHTKRSSQTVVIYA